MPDDHVVNSTVSEQEVEFHVANTDEQRDAHNEAPLGASYKV